RSLGCPSLRAESNGMRMRGLEPPRACAHTALNRARLPIPPHPRGDDSVASPRAATRSIFGLRRGLLLLVAAGLTLPLGASSAGGPPRLSAPGVELIVTLKAPPL